MSPWQGRAAATGVGIAITLLLLAVAELSVRAFWRPVPPPQADYEPEYWSRNERGRGHPSAPGAWRSRKADPVTGETVYDVVYQIDDRLRRATPLSSDGPRERFALLFGGSFTFGEGVRDDETAAYHVGVLAPRYRSLNYGFHGGGPADALSRFEEGSLRGELDEPRGILVYTFIDDHVPRTVGTLRLVSSWGRAKPCYEVVDGEVVFRGPFQRARPLRDRIYRTLARSALLERLRFDWPLRIGAAEIETTVRVLARAKELFDVQLPGSRFVVVAYPGAETYGPALLAGLERLGVETLDLSRLFDASQPEYVLSPLDPHPSPLAHQTYARALVERLELNGDSPP